MENVAVNILADPLPFARSYQVEALQKAIKENTIAFLETGSGKTLIAVMLLRSYAPVLRKPSRFISVFLVPQVVLVRQQAEAIEKYSDLKVGRYWGEMGIDYWDVAIWKEEIEKHEVLVMTPQILLNCLRHSFFSLELIKILVFDECHHARGRHPYACIMMEFYHPQLRSNEHDLPRIFGMTASPIKAKGAYSEVIYWKKIHELENILHSKVYTCASESVLGKFIPFSTPRFKFYEDMGIPLALYTSLVDNLKNLQRMHERSLKELDLVDNEVDSVVKRISKVHSSLMYCLCELGVLLAFKAAQYLSCVGSDILSLGKLEVGDDIVKNFSLDASIIFANYISNGSMLFTDYNAKEYVDSGLVSSKVVCLLESLLEYRDFEDIRCIVFVDRVITAIVVNAVLTQFLPEYNSWQAKYIAGNNSGLQSQTRKSQNQIVEDFQNGTVNIIIATSILEEGLDVQSCNLVIRFDPSATVSSFIQSRGRARMQHSEYLLMVKNGDFSTHSRLENYLLSGDMMRKECLLHSSVPCSSPVADLLLDSDSYFVQATGAIVNLSSSVELVYFYCSRLPSDGYFKPVPRCVIDQEMGHCTMHMPKGSPIRTVLVKGDYKDIKQKACLEACKQLHKVGALTDNLVPDIVVEEVDLPDVGCHQPYQIEQHAYIPPELVRHGTCAPKAKYYCYLVELNRKFVYQIPNHDVVLALSNKLDSEIVSMDFNLDVDWGLMEVGFKYIGNIYLTPELVCFCRKFQITVFSVLIHRSVEKLQEILKDFHMGNYGNADGLDYLVFPSCISSGKPSIDWISVSSVLFSSENSADDHMGCSLCDDHYVVQTMSGPLCRCKLQNCLVYTPHSGIFYSVIGIFDDLNGNSTLTMRDGGQISYKDYYNLRHGIQLNYVQELFLKGRHIFPIRNYLYKFRQQRERESRNAYVELPPEICSIILSPISISTFYTFTFVPSIIHRLESFLLAANFRMIHLNNCLQGIVIPTTKVLEAITTNKCQEKFSFETVETLGDSFIKYAISQQLFKTQPDDHEGLLSVKKDKLISNFSLCKLGCERKISGFIRNNFFEPASWSIPGHAFESNNRPLKKETFPNAGKMYIRCSRQVKIKMVADVVEALVGVCLCTGGEAASLLFLNWIGLGVDFLNIPYDIQAFPAALNNIINIMSVELLLNYKFNDPSLLVEALTHGSCTHPDIPRSYQRLEFLGDSVLDYLITLHLFNTYRGLSPGMLNDMRSASVNNDSYARAAIKEGLHKHILYDSQKLEKHLLAAVQSLSMLPTQSTFGWEESISIPKVLGDVIEAIAGAILVDSGYNKELVFQTIRIFLEPMVSPETVTFHPMRQLNEFCQSYHLDRNKPIVCRSNGKTSVTIEVYADDRTFTQVSVSEEKRTAKKQACIDMLRVLNENKHLWETTRAES